MRLAQRDRGPGARRVLPGGALGDRRAERLTPASAVRLARRAHLMRPLGPMADRAPPADPRRLELVGRAALVAARFRRFSLGDFIAAGNYSDGRPLSRPGPGPKHAGRHPRLLKCRALDARYAPGETPYARPKLVVKEPTLFRPTVSRHPRSSGRCYGATPRLRGASSGVLVRRVAEGAAELPCAREPRGVREGRHVERLPVARVDQVLRAEEMPRGGLDHHQTSIRPSLICAIRMWFPEGPGSRRRHRMAARSALG